jgi:hypothetical protein
MFWVLGLILGFTFLVLGFQFLPAKLEPPNPNTINLKPATQNPKP